MDITKVDANRHLHPTVYPHMAGLDSPISCLKWPTVCGNQQRGGSFDSVQDDNLWGGQNDNLLGNQNIAQSYMSLP